MEQFTQQIIPFIIKHWLLCAALIVVVLAIIFEELKSRINAPRLSAQQTVLKLNHDEIVLVDIRTPTAFHKDHIAHSVNVPESKNLDEMVKKLHDKKEQHLVLVCNLGQQATAVAGKLRAKGFTKVSILEGGITAWKQAGLPTNKAK